VVSKTPSKRTRNRALTAASCERAHRRASWFSLVAVLVVGLYAKLYGGPAREWVNDSFAGVFYVIFWCLFASLVFPGASARRIAMIVFAATCFLECLQLWHPPFLEWLRSGFVGRALLGRSFDLSDFPYYVLGSLAGWLWITRLRRVGDHDAER
jgi:hypothetical protein